MAIKVNQELINKMLELYKELKTYAAVAKELGVSASTCSKYIKAAQAEQKNKAEAAKNFIPFDKEIKPIEEIKIDWNDCCYLNEEEVREITELWKEI